jgi:hypothetical protein
VATKCLNAEPTPQRVERGFGIFDRRFRRMLARCRRRPVWADPAVGRAKAKFYREKFTGPFQVRSPAEILGRMFSDPGCPLWLALEYSRKWAQILEADEAVDD